MSFAGHAHTDETKQRLSEGMRGKPKTPEHARSISEGLRRRFRNGGVTPHGTPARYKSSHCRCDDCRVAWNDYKLERKRIREGPLRR